MRGNPAIPGGPLTSKPTWWNTSGCSTTSAFFSPCGGTGRPQPAGMDAMNQSRSLAAQQFKPSAGARYVPGPRRHDSSDTPLPVRPPMITPRPVSSSRILLVDDYPDSAESMALVLRLWGYQPLVAFDGITGLEMALSRRPAAIFLDVRLPRMDGHEVARRIRAEPGMEKTPLLALTGCGQVCDRQASLAAGFDRHLVKPVDLEELRHLLGELVTAP